MGKRFVDDYLPYLLARASHQISATAQSTATSDIR